MVSAGLSYTYNMDGENDGPPPVMVRQPSGTLPGIVAEVATEAQDWPVKVPPPPQAPDALVASDPFSAARVAFGALEESYRATRTLNDQLVLKNYGLDLSISQKAETLKDFEQKEQQYLDELEAYRVCLTCLRDKFLEVASAAEIPDTMRMQLELLEIPVENAASQETPSTSQEVRDHTIKVCKATFEKIGAAWVFVRAELALNTRTLEKLRGMAELAYSEVATSCELRAEEAKKLKAAEERTKGAVANLRLIEARSAKAIREAELTAATTHLDEERAGHRNSRRAAEARRATTPREVNEEPPYHPRARDDALMERRRNLRHEVKELEERYRALEAGLQRLHEAFMEGQEQNGALDRTLAEKRSKLAELATEAEKREAALASAKQSADTLSKQESELAIQLAAARAELAEVSAESDEIKTNALQEKEFAVDLMREAEERVRLAAQREKQLEEARTAQTLALDEYAKQKEIEIDANVRERRREVNRLEDEVKEKIEKARSEAKIIIDNAHKEAARIVDEDVKKKLVSVNAALSKAQTDLDETLAKIKNKSLELGDLEKNLVALKNQIEELQKTRDSVLPKEILEHLGDIGAIIEDMARLPQTFALHRQRATGMLDFLEKQGLGGAFKFFMRKTLLPLVCAGSLIEMYRHGLKFTERVVDQIGYIAIGVAVAAFYTIRQYNREHPYVSNVNLTVTKTEVTLQKLADKLEILKKKLASFNFPMTGPVEGLSVSDSERQKSVGLIPRVIAWAGRRVFSSNRDERA